MISGKAFDMLAQVRSAPVVHDLADALDVLATLKQSAVPMALVHDEYGNMKALSRRPTFWRQSRASFAPMPTMKVLSWYSERMDPGF
jgi:hypothetical protein